MVETRAKRPIDSLAEDHIAVIAQLNRLREAGAKLTSVTENQVDEAKIAIGEVATFLATELELHLRKEEEALFPPLENVIGASGGPTAVMRYEHVDLREQNQELQKLVADFDDAEKTLQNIKKLEGTIVHIYNVLTQHIHKEDFILFPMANDALKPQDMEKVATKMIELEASR